MMNASCFVLKSDVGLLARQSILAYDFRKSINLIRRHWSRPTKYFIQMFMFVFVYLTALKTQHLLKLEENIEKYHQSVNCLGVTWLCRNTFKTVNTRYYIRMIRIIFVAYCTMLIIMFYLLKLKNKAQFYEILYFGYIMTSFIGD